jgi:tRNA(fMet)-specific endonuclease VapC
MTFILDTTTLSALMRRDLRVRARTASLSPSDRVVICTITRGEVLYGLIRLPQSRRRSVLEAEAVRIFSEFSCLPVPEAAGDQYAKIKFDAESSGTPLDENDLWIAATALSLSATLVTADTDFQRVRSLRTENWT